MLMSKLVGERTKTIPSEAVIKSHIMLLKAGFIKLVTNGVWTLSMPAKRIAENIQRIIREEMDSIGGQECLFPVVMPRDLWEESGRFNSIGDEMVRFKDRNDRDLVLGMTHEEAAVHFVRDSVKSYQQLPFMIYQIQTKFRDEARSRGGLIRVREFTMKDGYSFHETQDDLADYYEKVYEAYFRIFSRIGLKKFIAVKSDTGMMGGSIAHEYMLLTDVGEDTLIICPNCDYKANMEVAECKPRINEIEDSLQLEEVFTGSAKEIKEVSSFLGEISEKKIIKAVCYNIKGDSDKTVLCFIRGDLEINEAKLKKVLKAEIVPANLSGTSIVPGNIGPVKLEESSKLIMIYDKSLMNCRNMVCGANKEGYHLINVCLDRDFYVPEFHDISKVNDQDFCPKCGARLKINNGIEIGNIFQLGTKYTKSMEMKVLNRDGKEINPIMGCYGIGIGRAISAIAEEYADDKGLNWPISVAPWKVYICALRIDNQNILLKANDLYDKLSKAGVETIFDDREASPGFKFADCDLMGIPIRLVISPRSLEKNVVELQKRDGSLKEEVPYEKCVERIIQLCRE